MKKDVIAKIETFNIGDHYSNMAVIDLNEKVFSIRFSKKDLNNFEIGKAYLFKVNVEELEDRTIHTLIKAELIEDALDEETLSEVLPKLYKYAPISRKDMRKGIEGYLNKITNKNIKLITNELYKKYQSKFYVHPAATKMHHAYVGGLAHHTLSMLNLVDSFIKVYPYLKKDVLYAGIILHDLGKIDEMTGVDGEYTKEGQLIGHLVGLAIEIEKVAIKHNIEDSEEVLILKHIAISHHGLPHYGAAKRPQTAEALLIWYLDTIDSKLGPLGDEFDETAEGEFTNSLNVLDRIKFYKDKIK